MDFEGLLISVNEMLETKNYPGLRALLRPLFPADIARLMEEVPEEKLPFLFRLLNKETAAETFVELSGDLQELLIQSFSDKELREMVDELYVDDAVDLVEEMPANVVSRILKQASPEMRRSINDILRYPKDSAGSIMTTEYVALKRTMTVADAFARIKQVGVDKETIYTCYVTDEQRHLIGIITARTMMLSDADALVGDLMETDVIAVSTRDDKEEAALKFNKYGFLALPVVDGESRLVGIVTVDDAITVLAEEATEDIEKMAAITPGDKPYLRTGVWETFLRRIPWLLILMVSATFTGLIIAHYEEALGAYIVLTSFIPMLMDTGGNAGGQTSVTVIRGLALDELHFRDMGRVVWKEFRVAGLCAVTLGIVNFGKLLLIDQVTAGVALVVCLTLCGAVFIAKCVGCVLPMCAKRIGFDPALMASPFITTIVDALALILYFQVASAVLGV